MSEKYYTQMEAARKGIITEEMRVVARKEYRTEEEIRDLVAKGQVAICANKRHKCLDPNGVGSMLRTKINVNLGVSKDCKDYEVEMEKVMAAVNMGAEAIMDLSSHGNTQPFRRKLTQECPAMIGTVPVYDSVIHYKRDLATLTAKDFIDVVRLHAEDGVDFVTLHCGITRKTIEQIKKHKRKMNIVSRGGSLVFAWMSMTGNENPFYEYFDEILEICREYDVTISLGDACRPGCLADASDVCQIEELVRLGELTKRAWAKDVQVMVEGPGHMPLDQIEANMKLQQTIPEAATVNIIGFSTCYPNWEGDMLELHRMLTSIGIKVNLCLLTNGTQLQELQKIGQAALNVVINKELGATVAEWLFNNLKQDYIIADIPYGFTASINWLKKIATALKIETNIEALEYEIAAARENIFDSFSALCDIDNSWSLKRMVISAGSSCAHSLAAVIKKDLSMVEQCFVRINGPNEENRNCNYQRWQYAGDLPKLNENEYQILCGTDRERSEIGNISQTIYINSAMPAEKISVPSATYAGIRGWTHFMQTVFRQLRLFIYLKKESI